MQTLANRYDLHRCIGRGGFGAVWLATDRESGREVAIKLLNVADASGESSSSAQRLEREAVVTATLEHPNVVRVLDTGRLPDTNELYIVMERLAGRTLLEELREVGPLDPARAQNLLAGALRGLDEAHRVGVVHKDLKPANLFVVDPGGSDELMKVIDFGIARMNSLERLTQTGRMVGSPRYLAPEYILENQVTPRVDVYQIGLILAEAITGRPGVPRGLDFVRSCQRHVRGELEFDEDFLETPLGEVVLRATQLNPAHRFETAAEFAAAIADVPAPTQRYELTAEQIALHWAEAPAKAGVGEPEWLDLGSLRDSDRRSGTVLDVPAEELELPGFTSRAAAADPSPSEPSPSAEELLELDRSALRPATKMPELTERAPPRPGRRRSGRWFLLALAVAALAVYGWLQTSSSDPRAHSPADQAKDLWALEAAAHNAAAFEIETARLAGRLEARVAAKDRRSKRGEKRSGPTGLTIDAVGETKVPDDRASGQAVPRRTPNVVIEKSGGSSSAYIPSDEEIERLRRAGREGTQSVVDDFRKP